MPDKAYNTMSITWTVDLNKNLSVIKDAVVTDAAAVGAHTFKAGSLKVYKLSMNADGTITLKSFSYWGQGDAAEAFRQELAELEERNRQARAEWDSLTPEEREQRTRDFEAQKKARAEAMRDAAEIPPHVLAKIDGKEPPDPDAVFT